MAGTTHAAEPSSELALAVRDRRVPISVLDVAVVASGATFRDALERTTRLARFAEELGARRIWVAEHHNSPQIASSSPDVLIAHIASATSRIRVGSGGVMLPNHAPLVVAERFATLEALYPGRVDLGIGRAPGTDRRTAAALRRDEGALSGDGFIEQLEDLRGHILGFPDDHPKAGLLAVPGGPDLMPPLWLLGSSGFSAQVAALLGQRFAFAHHISPENTIPALRLHRDLFRPSAELAAPETIVTAHVICADTDEEAQRLSLSSQLSRVWRALGQRGPLPSPEEAEQHPWTPAERAHAEMATVGHIVGDPPSVRARLERLAAASEADEVMITTRVHSEEAQRRSLELLAAELGTAQRFADVTGGDEDYARAEGAETSRDTARA